MVDKYTWESRECVAVEEKELFFFVVMIFVVDDCQ